MNPIDLFIAELEHEMTATMRQLEAIPAAKLEWQPHPKSMSIGKLGMHIATIPGQICQMATLDVFEFPENFGVPQPASKEEILQAAAETIPQAKAALRSLTPAQITGDWTAKAKGHTLMTIPRMAMIRNIVCNHWYHHRGQMQVYLRLLDVPVPSVYGPTADVNPFM